MTTARPARSAFADGKHRGMSYAHGWRRAEERGYGSAASAESLRLLKDLGVTWISITPFGFQTAPHDTTIRWDGSRFSETDDRLRAVTAQAHALGIKVMLKPHLWLRPPAWVGSIEHTTEDAWAAWFAAYGEFILHYARLAEDARVDALCVGNEIEKTTRREGEWRATIAAIRRAYGGPITYGAGFTEIFDVPFWDALDFIGVSAYYTLVDGRSPTRAEIAAAWQPLVARLEALSRRWNKPIVFTELGYRSADFAARQPWKVDRAAPVNLQLQADAYGAFFDVVWPQPWFGGVHWWKWFSYPDDGGPDDNDYTPRNKPAERVIGEYYRSSEQKTEVSRQEAGEPVSQPVGRTLSGPPRRRPAPHRLCPVTYVGRPFRVGVPRAFQPVASDRSGRL